MANLKNIRDRITSINNTQKITRAMKMVAAAKVKKSENRVKTSRPFSKELAEMLQKLLGSYNLMLDSTFDCEKALDNCPALLRKRKVKKAGLLIVSSNKGLAGAFNANVVRHTLKKIQEYNAQGLECKLFIIGQKALNALKKVPANLDYEIIESYIKFAADPTSASASIVAEDMAKALVDEKIDSIEVVTTKFKNMMSYSVEDWKILPLEKQDTKDGYTSSKMEFEPDLETILQKTLPLFIANTIFQALLESTASELASRMTAMSAACNNAEEMIRTLTVDYNKARQTAITQEITEVVSGADSLK